MKKILIIILTIIIIILAVLGSIFFKDKKEIEQNNNKPLSYSELSNLALDYYMNNNSYLLDKKEYNVGISKDVIPKYQSEDMVVIEIRHLNGSISALDARYYINIYTASGYDDMEKKIDLKNR